MAQPWKAMMLGGWSPRKAVELAVAIEERGEAAYQLLAARWHGDEPLRRLFTKLSGEEAAHQEGFRTLLARAEHAPDGVTPVSVEQLRATAEGFFQDGDGWALSGIEELSDAGAILEKILTFEKATMNFYRGLRDVIGADATLDRLIGDEQRHIEEVKRAIARRGAGR